MPRFDDLRSSDLFLLLTAHPEWVGAAIAAIAFVESFALIGILVPGVAMLAIAAFVAGSGTLDLGPALACAFVGAVLGDGVSFLLGRRLGPGLQRHPRLTGYRHWLARGEGFFDRHGPASVALGRFVGPIRPVIPLVAGMVGMPGRLFLVVNLLSALAWAPAYVLPGFLVGASLAHALHVPADWPWALALTVAGGWLAIRLVIAAWRLGIRGGRLERLLGGPGGWRAWLGGPLTSAGADTRASLLAATAALLGILAVLGGVVALPALAPWRSFLGDLLRVTLQLL